MIEQYIKDLVEKTVKEVLLKELETQKSQSNRFAYSLRELATALGCSLATVTRWKDEGKFKGCYKQIDRTLIFDLDKIDKKYVK